MSASPFPRRLMTTNLERARIPSLAHLAALAYQERRTYLRSADRGLTDDARDTLTESHPSGIVYDKHFMHRDGEVALHQVIDDRSRRTPVNREENVIAMVYSTDMVHTKSWGSNKRPRGVVKRSISHPCLCKMIYKCPINGEKRSYFPSNGEMSAGHRCRNNRKHRVRVSFRLEGLKMTANPFERGSLRMNIKVRSLE